MTPEELKRIVENAQVDSAAAPDYRWQGDLLHPRLWEALRTELQRRYRRSTGEPHAVLTVDLTEGNP